MRAYEECTLCPRECRVNRYERAGYCGGRERMRIARAGLHFWEEPCISGTKGSGAIFFVGCNMGCIFCQNHEISMGTTGREISRETGKEISRETNRKSGKETGKETTKEAGKETSPERLVEIFHELKDKGANNINLVTADIYIPEIREAISRARESGFDLPFILNTSSYIRTEALKSLEGLIDIYLPDFKYIRDRDAIRYSKAKGYPEAAMAAIDEMVRQQSRCIFEQTDDGMMLKKGVIVRHLLLPGMVIQAKLILKALHDRYGDRILCSLLSQYTPNGMTGGFPEIDRRVKENEYKSLVRYAQRLGLEGYVQDMTSADECYVPPFDLSGV